MGNDKGSRKKALLKMEYPKNLLCAVIGGMEEGEVAEKILSGVQTLNEREQYILLERYKGKRTLSNIGEDLGLKRERVRQIEYQAFRKLRRNNLKK